MDTAIHECFILYMHRIGECPFYVQPSRGNAFPLLTRRRCATPAAYFPCLCNCIGMRTEKDAAKATSPQNKSFQRDSNPRPTDYESVALPTALWKPGLKNYNHEKYYIRFAMFCKVIFSIFQNFWKCLTKRHNAATNSIHNVHSSQNFH